MALASISGRVLSGIASRLAGTSSLATQSLSESACLWNQGQFRSQHAATESSGDEITVEVQSLYLPVGRDH